MPALADDSGLVVAALDGAPGIYSARWAAPNGDFDKAMQRVHDELIQANTDDMSAYFVCALALVWPDGDEISVEGRLAGQITWPPRGKFGFGYDAIFQPNGHSQSFGEMDPAAKHAMSHRADAFAQLVSKVFLQKMLTSDTKPNLALYVHWPFCRRKCPYCDFNSHVSTTHDSTEFGTALCLEMSYMAEMLPDRRALTSLFLAGGHHH